jgi:hypothetical protein
MATNNKDFRVKNGLVVEQDTNIGGDLVVTGTITGDGSGLSGVTSYTQTDFDADFATKDTDDLAEGTNLYYTTARFDDALATKDTDDLAEGTNLYYTTARANSDFDSRLALKSTSDLTEGTNLYYTDTRVGTYLSANSFATQTYVNTAVSNLVDAAPATLDTLNELAAALGDDPNFATTITTALGNKLDSSLYTASDVLTKIKTVDGTDSGLDADTLDGQQGSYYLDWTNVTNKPDPVITVTLTGDVTGTGNATLTDLASGTISFATTIVGSTIPTSSNIQLNSLGVGTAASNTTGEIRATNQITSFFSDERLKEDIEQIGDALDKVMTLRGVTYLPNCIAEQIGYKKEKMVGVIAQDVEKILPEAVKPAPFDIMIFENTEISKSGQNYKTVQYEKLVPLLIEAIKELNLKVDKLTKNKCQ